MWILVNSFECSFLGCLPLLLNCFIQNSARNLDFVKNKNALKDINELGDKILKTTFNEVVKLKG